MSRDAGRFVCNYTYYKSLQMTSRLQQQLMWQQPQQQQQHQQDDTAAVVKGGSNGNGQAAAGVTQERGVVAGSDGHGWPIFSLFVHMPSFDVVNQARQREFVLHLLDLVAKWVAGAGGGSSSAASPSAVAEANVASDSDRVAAVAAV